MTTVFISKRISVCLDVTVLTMNRRLIKQSVSTLRQYQSPLLAHGRYYLIDRYVRHSLPSEDNFVVGTVTTEVYFPKVDCMGLIVCVFCPVQLFSLSASHLIYHACIRQCSLISEQALN